MALKFDEIGYWSEVKLEIIEKYAIPYSIILSRNNFHHIYIDAFAGSGTHISRTTRDKVRGSPQIALDINPPFKEYYFIDKDGEKVSELNKLTENRPEAHVLHCDCNEILVTDIFPKVEYNKFCRALCLLDPYGLDLDWEVIRTAGHQKSIDMFLNFPVMDMQRNVFWENTEDVDNADITRMNTFWGDESWREVVYRPTRNLFGETVEIKESNKIIAKAFQNRLKDSAKFRFVPDPMPMRNSRGNIVYYLFFASNNQTAMNIVTDIFNKYRSRGMK